MATSCSSAPTRPRSSAEALGALRIKVGHDLNLLTCEWAPLWVVDFPMFEENDDGSLTAMHHPFTAPKCTPEELEANPAAALSRAYDMVLNGTELGGGSIRIHNKEMQQTVFRVLGISEEEQQEKFGFLLDALKFGAPPHGGLAFGLDRLVMLMTGASSIREVIAFPKTQSAACVMTQAPGVVDAKAAARAEHPPARTAQGRISRTTGAWLCQAPCSSWRRQNHKIQKHDGESHGRSFQMGQHQAPQGAPGRQARQDLHQADSRADRRRQAWRWRAGGQPAPASGGATRP